MKPIAMTVMSAALLLSSCDVQKSADNGSSLNDTASATDDDAQNTGPPGRPIAYSSKRFDVKLTMDVTNDPLPVFTGHTNLPDGTILYTHLLPPVPCDPGASCRAHQPSTGGDSLLGAAVTVKNGSFTAGPEWDEVSSWPREDGQPGLHAGSYVFETVLPPDDPAQPDRTLALLGKNNLNAYGPSVGACCWQEAELRGAAQAKKDIASLQGLLDIAGPTIYFATRIDVQ